MSTVVGVLGGTFDPVHFGHLHVASSVQRALSLPVVLLMPSAVPPHKAHGARAAAADRLGMVRLAVADYPRLAASSLEVERGGVCYTIETLRALRDLENLAPVFIIGMDALEEISTWHEYTALLREFDFVAVDRAGGNLREAALRLEPTRVARVIGLSADGVAADGGSEPGPGAGGRVFHLPIPLVEISSSLVRARAAAGNPLDGLVPPAVAGYIRSRHLYQEESPR